MTSLLSQIAMTDDAYRKIRQEDEDRAFKIKDRQQQEAQWAEDEYTRPFKRADDIKKREREQIKYNLEDKAIAEAEEAKKIGAWVKPFQPKTGMNEDGTRSMDVDVPMGPAMAAAAAAGMPGIVPEVSGFMKPFDGARVTDSRTYQTPEEIQKKAAVALEHKNKIEEIKEQNSGKEVIAGMRGSRTTSPGARPVSPKGPSFEQRQYSTALEKEFELQKSVFQSQVKRALTPEETAKIEESAAANVLARPSFAGMRPAAAPVAPATPVGITPGPTTGSPPKPIRTPDDEAQRLLKKHLSTPTQTAPITASPSAATRPAGVGLPTASSNANIRPPAANFTPTSPAQPADTAKSLAMNLVPGIPIQDENLHISNINPSAKSSLDQLNQERAELSDQLSQLSGGQGGLEEHIASGIIKDRIRKLDIAIIAAIKSQPQMPPPMPLTPAKNF
jgi:hypothetical protein